MFKVYWTDLEGKSIGKEFTDMTLALSFTQELRNQYKRKFVTLCSENPDCTSLSGVDEVSEDYSWKKRRI
jgi:hypothetical protein